MSDDKKARKMTLKGFVHKASSAKSAIGFLATHAEFIRQYPNLTSILAKYEDGKALATESLIQIRDLAFTRMQDEEIEAARQRSLNVREPKVKTYTVTIWNQDTGVGSGKVVEGESEGFSMTQEAEGWADRKLANDASSVYAEVVSTHIGKSGTPITWQIMRADAIARVFAGKRGPVMKQSAKSAGSLSFRPKVKEDRCHFSRG